MLLLLSLVLSLGACSLFEPREAEPPGTTTTPYAFVPPTAPEMVLDNLANAFPAAQPDYFLNSLVEPQGDDPGFFFIPDARVAEQQVGLFEDWDYNTEQGFVNSLFQRLSEGALQDVGWADIQLTNLENQTRIQVDYTVQLTYLPQERTVLPEHLAGRAYLTLERGDDQLYRILQWEDEDLAVDSLLCWSDLKAAVQ